MSFDSQVKAAVLLAARQHTPTLAAALVRWSHEPETAPAAHGLSVELDVVSIHDPIPSPRKVHDKTGPNIVTELEQLSEVSVQIKVRCVDLTKFSTALQLAQAIRFGLFTREVQELLEDPSDQTVLIKPLGPLMHLAEALDNGKAMNWLFEARFRFHLTTADPTDGDTLDIVQVAGDLDTNGDAVLDYSSPEQEIP